jgi:hypothetical protein
LPENEHLKIQNLTKSCEAKGAGGQHLKKQVAFRGKTKYLLLPQKALGCQNQQVLYFLLASQRENPLLYRILLRLTQSKEISFCC